MRRANCIDDFLSAPLGRYVVGRTFVVWFATPNFCGSVHWGERSEEDARQLLSLYALRDHPSLTPPFNRVIDGRFLEHIGPAAFEALFGPLRSQVDELRRYVSRQAVLVTPTFSGAVLAAMLPPLGPTDAYRVFHDPTEAFEYAEPEIGVATLDELDAIVSRERHIPEVLRALDEHLRANLTRATLSRAARALGISERSLQRELHDLETTFREQVLAARIRRAKSLLADTSVKVEVVARQVGCSSASQLGHVFRRAGEPPPASLRELLARSR